MELYVGAADRTVSLLVPVTPTGTTMSVVIKRDGVQVYEMGTVTPTTGGYSIILPFFLIQEEAELEVNWSFVYEEDGQPYEYNHSTHVNIVQPIIPLLEVQSIIGNNSDFTVSEIERVVRYTISSVTGQRFGNRHETKVVRGTGQPALLLPERLVDITSIEQYGYGYKIYDTTEIIGSGFRGKDLFYLDGDGWYLKSAIRYGDGIKADNGGYWNVTGPIYNPLSHSHLFAKSQQLFITGHWGWLRTPAEVEEAARILINDYACNETLYRDRYIQYLTTSDWRFQFNSQAFTGTGNVKADQLLSNYTLKRGWAVL